MREFHGMLCHAFSFGLGVASIILLLVSGEFLLALLGSAAWVWLIKYIVIPDYEKAKCLISNRSH
jgi:hypothetical protein